MASKTVRRKKPQPHPEDLSFRSHSSVVQFRTLSDTFTLDGTVYQVKTKNVDLEDDSLKRELSETSRISSFTIDATLPMAQDNDRFFLRFFPFSEETNQNQRVFVKEPSSEVGFFGWLWRFFVRLFIAIALDPINRLYLSRGLQDSLPYQAPHESLVLSTLIRELDKANADGGSNNNKSRIWASLSLVFKNSNTSRILMRNMLMSRFDFLWHWHTQLRNNRLFDFLSNLPFLGGFGFPATENFPSSKNHALRAIIRGFASGSWLTRFLTSNQQDLVTFGQAAAAQNLAAEGNGFEEANRNQYGTYFGRQKTNEFRLEHRLPTDESIIRTFMTSPASTMVNNGVEHVLRCLAKHWENMLYQENGNFAHQRMEQLNPFEIIRFHLPIVLVTLSNLRGRNKEDSRVLGPFVKRLQEFNPAIIQRSQRRDAEEGTDRRNGDFMEIASPCQAAQELIIELKRDIASMVCAGIPSRLHPFEKWLDAIHDAIDRLRSEAEEVKRLIDSTDQGLKLGYDILKRVDWDVPSKSKLQKVIVAHLRNQALSYDVSPDCINAALDKLAPKDKRTLRELVSQNKNSVESCRLLLGRTVTLLQREIRRKSLDMTIREASRGQPVSSASLRRNVWYLVESNGMWRVQLFRGKTASGRSLRFVDIDSNIPCRREAANTRILSYVPVAEAISRAQKVFMALELDHGKHFSYNALMEFGSVICSSSMRTRLRHLASVAQMQCSELDKARLTVLTEIKNSVCEKVNVCPPQSVVVIGGGPTGLLSAIHCAQSVIQSGGEVRVYESRDAYDKKAATFERAQIVRLDSRWVAMLRFHLGTLYEDIFVPAAGETDPHLGNVLPSQGFVEVTIKRLEVILNEGLVMLASRGLVKYYAESGIEFDTDSDSFRMKGSSLNVGDSIKLKEHDDDRIWRVKKFAYASSISSQDELVEGMSYDLVPHGSKEVKSYYLEEKDAEFDMYVFTAHDVGVNDIITSFSELPPIYPHHEGRLHPTGIIIQHESDYKVGTKMLDYDKFADTSFELDFSCLHVLIAAGKPHHSKDHLAVTTHEPYGVCCIEGLKISMGMHRFGQPRWENDLIDDFRSIMDQNTRIIGDFTKSVHLRSIVMTMTEKLKVNGHWRGHFGHQTEALIEECQELESRYFVRNRLQTRFFELGDNYYLGMEFPREFDSWKSEVVKAIVPGPPRFVSDSRVRAYEKARKTLVTSLDRLWFESTMAVISSGDVYNPGGNVKIPELFTIDGTFEQSLGELEDREAFKLAGNSYSFIDRDGNTYCRVARQGHKGEIKLLSRVKVMKSGREMELGQVGEGSSFEPVEFFEVLSQGWNSSLVRNSSGFVMELPHTVKVCRLSDLSRSPDGISESKVSIASFPVAHYVCHRTIKVRTTSGKSVSGVPTDPQDGFISALIGDAQASPHFMRYSGLTGAGINAMSFNNFVAAAIKSSTFHDRVRRYSLETKWSNGEVVQRGTGANYGGDGFLRPGFKYNVLINFLYDSALEHLEIGASLSGVVSRDWRTKIAAALVPRGLENDDLFLNSLIDELEIALRKKIEREVLVITGKRGIDGSMATEILFRLQRLRSDEPMVHSAKAGEPRLDSYHRNLEDVFYVLDSVIDALKQIMSHSIKLRTKNQRISSELFNQPKPVDTLYDDFPVEAQNFANSLTQSTAFATGAIALRLVNERFATIVSAVLGVLSLAISFGTMTNVSRYKNRNEEFRSFFLQEKFPQVLKGVFGLMAKDQMERSEVNPYLEHLERLVTRFLSNATYYDRKDDEIGAFKDACSEFNENPFNQRKIIHFMRMIVQQFLPSTFQDNSYLQEDLVAIYESLEQMLHMLKSPSSRALDGSSDLFHALVALREKLNSNVEDGEIQFGFLKTTRKLNQQSLWISIRFLVLFMFGCGTLSTIRKAASDAEKLRASASGKNVLRREIQDLRELEFATKESEIASMMFLSALIVFLTSAIFTTFRLVSLAADEEAEWVRLLLDITAWAAIFSLLGALLALFHFVRKMKHLLSLNHIMGKRPMNDRSFRQVRRAVRSQFLLTFVRLIAISAACIGLPWSVAVQTRQEDELFLNEDVPVFVAAGAVGFALFSLLLFFAVEFVVRYNLDPKLGSLICSVFRSELDRLQGWFGSPSSNRLAIRTSHSIEREEMEYVVRQFAHRHRFDTVFAADRFGSIVQYLQSTGSSHDHRLRQSI